jgi:hypothetical protein
MISGWLISVVLSGVAAAQATTAPATPRKTAGAAVTSAIASPAGAAAAAGGVHAAAHGGHGQVREALHRAHHLLVEADHDYDGHRARAAHEVHLAIEELGGHGHHAVTSVGGTATPSSATTSAAAVAAARRAVNASATGKAPAPKNTAATTPATAPTATTGTSGARLGTGTPAMHEAQGKSDAHLRRAREILRMVAGELSARHPRAHVHMREAIAEIDRALAIK